MTTELFQKHGLGYRFQPDSTGFRFTVEYVARSGDDIRGTVIADRRDDSGRWLRVHRGKVLMDGSRSKADFAKQCNAQHDDESKGKYWSALVEDLCGRVIDAEEQGEPIRKVGRLPERPKFVPLVDKLLPAFKPTFLYGPGGTGKGYIATAVAVCVQAGLPFLGLEVQQGNVLYLDWEDEEDELDERIKEVSRGLGLLRPPEFFRRGCKGHALRNQVSYLSQFIAENRVMLVIIDSVEAATGSMGDGGFHNATTTFFEALHKLGRVTSLLIDHVSGENKFIKNRTTKIYGDIFKENWARNCWEARKDQKPGAKVSHLALYHTKVNRGMFQEPIGIELDFTEEGRVVLRNRDVTESKELSERLPGPERVLACLIESDGPMSAGDIADELKEPDNKIRVWLGRLQKRGKAVKTMSGNWDLPPGCRQVADEIPF